MVSKLNPRFPRVWAVLGSVPKNSICSTELQVFKPKENDLYAFLYFLFTSGCVAEELEASASGTSGSHQRVTSSDMLNIKFALPSIESAKKFSKITIQFLEKMHQNRTAIRTLEKLRDNLLPKLMSGEVRVNCE